MHRDYWLYQSDANSEVKEPFAAHVYAFSDGYIDVSFYAEYIPAKTYKDLRIPATYENFMDAFDLFAGLHDVSFTSDDTRQINELWATIVKDFNF